MSELVAGLVLGLAGSLHCAAMCGPLTLALHGPARRRPGQAGPVLPLFATYHAGRIAMYAVAGLAAGSAGHVVANLGAGRLLAWLAGGALILGAAAHLGIVPALPVPPLARPIARLARIGQRAGLRHPAAGAFAGGILNAWLPCGMLYAALTAAAAFGRPGAGLVFMTLFGLGTTPALATVWLLAGAVSPGIRRGFRYGTPVALALVGLLLIARAQAGPSSSGPGAMPHAHGPATAGR